MGRIVCNGVEYGSMKGTTYTAGPGIKIDENGVISNTSRIVDITEEEYGKLTDEERSNSEVYYHITDTESKGDISIDGSTLEITGDTLVGASIDNTTLILK